MGYTKEDYALTRSREFVMRAAAATAATAEANIVGGASYIGDLSRVEILMRVTAAGTEAGDTLDVYIDGSWDGGVTFPVNIAHFQQVVGSTQVPHDYVLSMVEDIVTTSIVDAGVESGGIPTTVAAAGACRAMMPPNYIRWRYTTVDVVTTGNLTFNFGLFASGRT